MKYFEHIFRTVKLGEFPSLILMEQASRPYSKQGKNSKLVRPKLISSEADPPTSPYIALNARGGYETSRMSAHREVERRTGKGSRGSKKNNEIAASILY